MKFIWLNSAYPNGLHSIASNRSMSTLSHLNFYKLLIYWTLEINAFIMFGDNSYRWNLSKRDSTAYLSKYGLTNISFIVDAFTISFKLAIIV